MRKTDFQMEEDLRGSLRSIKPSNDIGDLITERYDTVFRKNLLVPEPKTGDDRKRSRKTRFKWHKSKGNLAVKL